MLYDSNSRTFWKSKAMETGGGSVVARGDGGQERKGWTEDFQGSETALHDNRNIGYMSRYIYPNPQKVENQYGALLQTRPRVSMT